MSKHHQSREEWEQEFRDVQRNVLPHEDVRSTSIIAHRAVEEGSALIRGPKQLLSLIIAAVVCAVGVVLGGFAVKNHEWPYAAGGALALLAAVLFGVAASRGGNRS